MATVDEQINQLEKDLRQLKIEYDAYFAGGRKRAPGEIEWRVQAQIKRLAETGGKLKYAQRFRYNNLAARYAKFSELWRQRSRRVEAGRSAFGYSKAARELEQQRLAEAEREHERQAHLEPARITLANPLKQSEQVQALYRKMMDAKSELGQNADLNFEQFHKFVRKKTEQLKKQMRCQQVEYTVSVEGGRVNLKAKGV
ncbi:MAG: MXAN_5187 C-terminal domain-containing protein [Terriglobia bacterium]